MHNCFKLIRPAILALLLLGLTQAAYGQLTQLRLPPSRLRERLMREDIIKKNLARLKIMQLNEPERKTAVWFEENRYNPQLRWIFLSEMPKGADLHNDLMGAAFAENLLKFAAQNGKCINTENYSLEDPPCHPVTSPPAIEVINDDELRNLVIDAWSMRNFPANKNGYRHYLSTFRKFQSAIQGHKGDILAEILQRAAKQNVLYVEIPLPIASKLSRELGDRAGIGASYKSIFKHMRQSGLDMVIDAARVDLNRMTQNLNEKLGCNSTHSKPGCYVKARFLYQVDRNLPPNEVFAEMAVGFMLVKTDPMVAGVNLSIPEDGGVAIRDYSKQMDMLDYFHKKFPTVYLSLTAGDLVQGLVPPQELTFHIREAISTAHASRIEQGIDIAYEKNPEKLMNSMKQKKILVLSCLATDNNFLGLNNENVPLTFYLNNHVPVALATCDEGINRSDLTNEFEIASTSFDIGYPELKEFARNSLEYSFLGGGSLWGNYDRLIRVTPCLQDIPGKGEPKGKCAAYLADNLRAKEEWQLEAQFSRFEANYDH